MAFGKAIRKAYLSPLFFFLSFCCMSYSKKLPPCPDSHKFPCKTRGVQRFKKKQVELAKAQTVSPTLEYISECNLSSPTHSNR